MHGILLAITFLHVIGARFLDKRSTSDQSVNSYLAERTCWWNEVCKEEFQNLFKCKCPEWSFCRAPGRYYNAHCSMTATGYIWSQPTLQEAGGWPLRSGRSVRRTAKIDLARAPQLS